MATIDLVPNIGSIITSRQSYLPTLDAGITNVISTAFWWRVGQHINIDGLLTFSGAGGAAEDLTVSLPTGLLMDITKLPGGAAATNQSASGVGYAFWFIQGSGWKFAYPNFGTTSSVFFIENTQHIAASEFASGDGFRYFLQAPIVGWG